MGGALMSGRQKKSWEVKNSGTWADSKSRVTRQLKNGQRCASCHILIFDTVDEMYDAGISKPCISAIAVRNDDKCLCSACAK
jgi:hypothetical protein